MGFVATCCVLALAGCPSVDLGDTPSDIGLCNPKQGIAYFESDIWPKYLHPSEPARDCVKSGCHANANVLALDPTLPIDYPKNYRVVQNYLNCGNPAGSYLLTKPLAGIDDHKGQDIFANLSDPAVVDFVAWFQ